MLLTSFWLDGFISPWLSPKRTYWHSVLLYWLTSAVFFLVARRLFGIGIVAFLVTVAWIMSSSVVVIVEFLSARHYLYGMLFALLSYELSERAVLARWRAANCGLVCFCCQLMVGAYFKIAIPFRAIDDAVFLLLVWLFTRLMAAIERCDIERG